uniref:Uncharacterized protein n=1 Tax=Daphnia galeata TaxID=27404 RepID=A0A8J2S7J5_9CRUS|nr:unnamed protein product [Daphnia galeata]
MKRQFSISVKTSASKFFVSLTFVLQFLLGLSNQTEVHLSVFFHFNQRIRNRQTDSTVCIGPFSSDVSRNCDPHGCRNTRNFVDITTINLMVGKNGTENNQNLKSFLENSKSSLFVDLDVKCTWLKKEQFLIWYVNWCDYNKWPNDRRPKCQDTTTTTPRAITTQTTTEITFRNPVTSTTTSSTEDSVTTESELPITSYLNVTRFPPITHQKWTTIQYRQKENSTPAGFSDKQSPKKSNDNTILWISLGAAAVVFTVIVFVVFCQRSKIAKFLRKSGNRDIADDAFYYRDMSMRRRENQQPAPDIVTYENIIPNLFLINEPVYTELDLSVQHNLNSENAAAGINSTPLQKRDIKSYVDSVIYADLHKC